MHMTSDVARNKAIFSEFQRTLNHSDPSLEVLGRFVKADVIDHTAAPGELQGLEGVQQRMAAWRGAFAAAT